MPVLIDGNNLLFAGRDDNPERPIGRSRLCELLGEWAERFGQSVSVVFDGPAPSGGLLRQIGDPRITVRFSGAASADEVIEMLVNADSAARRVVVVSSDREVARAARRRRATPMRSDEFWRMLLDDLARPVTRSAEPDEKRAGLGGDDATDAWVRELRLDSGTEAVSPPRRRRGRQRR